MHLIQTDLNNASEREFIRGWVFYLKSEGVNLGGIVTAHDARNPNARYLQSLASGERQYLRLCENEEDVRVIYAWAAEEIICAYRAKVDVLVFDYLGPEIIVNLGLGPALRAVELEHSISSREHITKVIIFTETSAFHSGFFHQLNSSSLKQYTSVQQFLESKVAAQSFPSIVELSQAILHGPGQLLGTYSSETSVYSEEADEHSILRLPVLLTVLSIIFTELTAYAAIRQAVNLIERVLQSKPIKKYKRRMSRATAYGTWSRLARELDIIERRGSSQINPALASFSTKFLQLFSMNNLSSEDVDDLLSSLADCSSSVSTLVAESHYSSNNFGSNVNFSMFVNHYIAALSTLKDIKVPLMHNLDMDIRERRGKTGLRHRDIEVDSKDAFMHELSRRFGTSALLLSGGAANAYHHLGVVKCLLENNLLPRHFSGASGGALIGALVCSHTDNELRSLLNDKKRLSQIFDPCEGGWTRLAKNWYKTGTLFDVDAWIEKLKKKVCGSLTFLEAYKLTGRSFTITVYNVDDEQNHTRCLNYKTTPNVVIYSAVLASSALPTLLPPIELLHKDKSGNITQYHSYGKFWRDGSFENELPVETLYEQFNVKFTIVSMVEPHISPFFYENKGAAGKVVQSWGSPSKTGWRGGFALSFLERALKHHCVMLMELVRNFKLIPKIWQTDINSLFLGRTKGTVTMVVPVNLRNYLDIVSDPDTPAKMGRYISTGEQMVFPKLQMIRDNLSIEQYLARLTGEVWSK